MVDQGYYVIWYLGQFQLPTMCRGMISTLLIAVIVSHTLILCFIPPKKKKIHLFFSLASNRHNNIYTIFQL